MLFIFLYLYFILLNCHGGKKGGKNNLPPKIIFIYSFSFKFLKCSSSSINLSSSTSSSLLCNADIK
ncbi:hypothetical protein D1N77_07230, partial [Clostridioides difficile]